jgi:MoaA/NifB/PqqE/SkfB family radical SAM enzyme
VLPLEVRPSKIRLEACSACQLRCPSCPTTTHAAKPMVGSGFLKFDDFKALIDANPWLKQIELSNYGEIFVNPELAAIIAYAHGRGVQLHCDNGANLNNVDESVIEALVRYGFRSITCSIDGASQETYSQYRVRGDFDDVINTVRRINHYKRSLGSEFPALTWQFIAFGHNEHEIAAAKKLATELGMGFYVKLSWDSGLSPVHDPQLIRNVTGAGAATREEFKEKRGHDYMQGICAQLWETPQINWDGKVLGCARNFWGEFGGNAFTDGLLPSINSEKMRYARRMLQGDAPHRDDIPCATCEIYLGRRQDTQWVGVKIHRNVDNRPGGPAKT